MANTQQPFVNSNSRVWLLEGGARPDHTPQFLNFMKLGGLEKNFGSTSPIYQPSPTKYGKFVQAGSYRDEEERPTASLMGQYPQIVKSKLLELGQAGCDFDIQLHIGQCQDPSVFNDFQKVLIFEGVSLESFSSDELGALAPGDQGEVEETGEFSATLAYEYVPVTFANRTPNIVDKELVDGVLCDSASCGDCEDESTGSQKIFAVSKAGGGSAGTPADVIFTLDKGVTWAAHDVDSLGAAEEPDGIACVGNYLVVISEASGDMHIALRSEFENDGDPSFTAIATGFNAAGAPRAIFSLGRKALVVGAGGYVYKIESGDPNDGVTAIDEGVATTSPLNDVHAFSDDFAVAVGDDGVILTINGDLVNAVTTSPVGIGTDVTSVWVKNETEWLIGLSTGAMYYTLNGGTTWTLISLSGSPSNITDIQFSTKSVGYVSGVVSSKGAMWITVDGGASWERAPHGNAVFPASDSINALVVSPDDVDFVVGVGLADDGTDGHIIIGSD